MQSAGSKLGDTRLACRASGHHSQLQRQQRVGSRQATRPSTRHARCSGPAAADGAPPPSPCRPAANPHAEVAVSRSQLMKGGLLAAGGLLLSSATPGQAARAAEAAGEPVVAAAGAVFSQQAAQHFSQVLMRTLADCQLAVSVYPTFAYDAAGGGGTGSVTQGEDGLLHLSFDPTALAIPPINAQHASIIGIPVPPPFNIAIVPQRLEGTLDPVTGRCDLEFLASFEFTAGPLYRAAPLTVATTLTTEASDGVMRHGVGQRLRADGRARLVGVARVPRTEDAFVNTFLQLPTDALAVLSAELEFS